MINRRSFLKLFTALPLLKTCGLPKLEFDIVSAFANAQDGGVIDIPPGTHLPTAPLSLRDKKRVIVNGNNATIYPLGDFSGKPVLDMAGTYACKIKDLCVQSPAAANTLCSVAVGRTNNGQGAGNVFSGLKLEGVYTGATVYSVCAEGNTWRDCLLQTTGNAPVLINTNVDFLNYGLVESSNCLLWMQNCTFAMYGTSPYTILLKGFVDGMTVKDCFMYLGNSTAFRMESVGWGYNHFFHLEDIRCEGSENSLLIDNVGEWATTWKIENIAWMIFSPYIMQSDHNIIASLLDFTFCSYAYATKWLRLTNGATLQGVDLVGNWDGKITSE